MTDRDLCPRCKFENARCACPKSAPAAIYDTDLRQRLAESVTQAVKAHQDSRLGARKPGPSGPG